MVVVTMMMVLVKVPGTWCCQYDGVVVKDHPFHVMNVAQRQVAADPRAEKKIGGRGAIYGEKLPAH